MSVYGTSYFVGSFVLLPRESNDLPLDYRFGKVETLLIIDGKPSLFVKMCKSELDMDYDLYFVSTVNEYKVIDVTELADFHPVEGYYVGESKRLSVSLNHYVYDTL